VIIFGDNDENCAGQAAAYALAHRLAVKNRMVHVKLPPDSGRDWNDELWLNRKTAIPEGAQRCGRSCSEGVSSGLFDLAELPPASGDQP
jgi:phage/plasmid primase-like uncharacterized protein